MTRTEVQGLYTASGKIHWATQDPRPPAPTSWRLLCSGRVLAAVPIRGARVGCESCLRKAGRDTPAR